MAQKRAEALAGLEEMDIDVSSPAKTSPRSGSPSSREGSPKTKAKGLTAHLEKLQNAAATAAAVKAYDGVHRYEVERLLSGVEVELALTPEARAARHAGDRAYAEGDWEAAHKAYVAALGRRIRSVSWQLVVGFSEQMAFSQMRATQRRFTPTSATPRRSSSGRKSCSTARAAARGARARASARCKVPPEGCLVGPGRTANLQCRLRRRQTAVATSHHSSLSSKLESPSLQKNNMAVVALEKSIRAGGGLGSSGVPMHLTAVPGDDGKAELANVSPRPTQPLQRVCGLTACLCVPDLEDEGQDAVRNEAHARGARVLQAGVRAAAWRPRAGGPALGHWRANVARFRLPQRFCRLHR